MVYVKRRGFTTRRFTQDIEKEMLRLISEGKSIVSLVPDDGLFEVEGMWIVWRS